jgi:hypothetical protein
LNELNRSQSTEKIFFRSIGGVPEAGVGGDVAVEGAVVSETLAEELKVARLVTCDRYLIEKVIIDLLEVITGGERDEIEEELVGEAFVVEAQDCVPCELNRVHLNIFYKSDQYWSENHKIKKRNEEQAETYEL